MLVPTQADEALKIYKKYGWLKSMAEQVGEVEGKVKRILSQSDATLLFNVRFRQDDADIYDPLVMADRKDAVWKRQRYTLAAATECKGLKAFFNVRSEKPSRFNNLTAGRAPQLLHLREPLWRWLCVRGSARSRIIR